MLRGRWQVSLNEIHYPRTLATLTPQECSFVVIKGGKWREVSVDSGYYAFDRDLVAAINDNID